MQLAAQSRVPGWQAELRLRFARQDPVSSGETRTRLVERRHRGPLLIQRPFYPEGDPCHVYLVHPPGGVVGGDELRLDVKLDDGAHALITTPAATKFYRCPDRESSQQQELRADGAALEWLPQENIFYQGANVRAGTRIHVDAASRFIGWEIACLGLPARGEHFESGRLKLDLELWRAPAAGVANLGQDAVAASRPLFVDRMRLDSAAPARLARWGLAGQSALGTLLATPATPAQVDGIRELMGETPNGAVTLVDGVLVLRLLAAQGEIVRRKFVEAWRLLRPAIIGRAAVLPRIWAT